MSPRCWPIERQAGAALAALQRAAVSTDGTTLTLTFDKGSKPAGAQFSVSGNGASWNGEVDLVITHGARMWGVEVKASATVTTGDGRGLLHLAERCGDDFQRGIVLYDGRDLLPLRGARILAVPISRL